MMKKTVYVLAFLSVLSSGIYASKAGPAMTRQQREVGASAIDSLAVMLPQVERGVIDDAFIALETEMDPELHEKLECLNERASMLKDDIKEAQDRGRSDRDPVIVALKKEQNKVKAELEELLYNGGPLHYRSILALGLALCLAIVIYKRANTLHGGIWSATKWGSLFLVFSEVMMRGKYAYFSGKVWSAVRQIVIGLSKLVGADSLGEKGLGWFQGQMRGVSEHVEKVMGNGRGMWITLGVLVVCAGLTYKCKNKRSGARTLPPSQAGSRAVASVAVPATPAPVLSEAGVAAAV